MDAHDFTARPLTSRFAADAPWLVGFVYSSNWPSPNVLRSFVTDEVPPLRKLTFMDFARIAVGLVLTRQGQTWYTHVYNLRIFPA